MTDRLETEGYYEIPNDTETGEHKYSRILELPDGGWIVVWQGTGPGDASGIFLRRFDSDGNVVGGEMRVNGDAAGGQYNPALALLSNGDWVVSWWGQGADDAWGIYQQRYNSAGEPVFSGLVNATVGGHQSYPEVAALADGGWLVVWQGDGPGDGSGVMQRRYDADGNSAGPDLRVNTTVANSQAAPSVAVLEDGGWVIAWQSNLEDGDKLGIYAQRFTAAGAAVGDTVLVNATTAGDQGSPSIAALDDGGWVVVWHGNGDGDTSGIFQQHYASDGSKVGGEARVSTTTDGEAIDPFVAAAQDGGWHVAWTVEFSDGKSSIIEQSYDADGLRVDGELELDSDWNVEDFGLHPKGHPSVAVLEDGRWMTSWETWYDGDPVGTDLVIVDGFAPHRLGSDSADTLTGTGWTEVVEGQRGNDVLLGGAGEDTLRGGRGYDTIDGGAGYDSIRGGRGKDRLDGGIYDDKMFGGKGHFTDTLIGGLGRDTLTGGEGADRFRYFTANEAYLDTILDFDASEGDKIVLRGIDADKTLDGQQDFVFDEEAGQPTLVGHLGWEVRGTSHPYVVLHASTDADVDFEVVITLRGVTSLSASDFIL